MSLADIDPSSAKIDKIIHRIEEGDIKIPAFQRGFVWKQKQVMELLDSIYRDYPMGSILLWTSNDRLNSTRNIGGFLIPDREPEYPVKYVLDGQQRLSAIYAVFCKDRHEAPKNSQYNIDPKIFNIFFDLDDGKFLAKEDVDAEHANLKLSVLFDNPKFINEIKKFDNEYQKLASEVQSKFQNYGVPIITINKRKQEEVGIIFERINNTGTALNTLNLMIARTWKDNFHLGEKIGGILTILKSKGFGDTPEKIILQCLSAIIEKTTKTEDIIELDPATVRDNINNNRLKEGLEKAIDFLSTQLNVTSRDFLPHSHQIVPLAFFFSRVNAPDQNQSKILKQWFWKTSFSRRYSGGTDKKMNDDISFFEKVISSEYSGIDKYLYSIDEKILVEQKFIKNTPYTKAFLLLLAQNGPLDLVNGNEIDLGTALSKYNLKEYHHIFPKDFLKKKGVKPQRINSLCNFCFLPSDSNKLISNKSPNDYIFNTTPDNEYSRILESNLMPLKKEIYSENQYDEFLNHRARKIVEYLDSKLV